MTESTKAMLEQIKTFFDKEDSTSRVELWNILTGLRGPDDGDYRAKAATTAVIRYYVTGLCTPADTAADSEERAQFRRVMGHHEHFTEHMRSAFEALGLEWEKVNKEKE